MNKRKLLIGLIAAGVLSAGFGTSVFSASAQQRTFVVTFLGGAQKTVTVDVPPGTPVDQIALPGIDLPILSIEEVTQPEPAPAPAPEPEQPGATAPTPDPTVDEPQGGEEAQEQKTTGKRKRKPQPQDAILDELAGDDTPATERDRPEKTELRTPGGQPTDSNPTTSLALPGPAPIGVPNFFIDKFRIPPFLLPIYQAAGIQYGIRWEILAAINEIETDYGRNLNVSSAGALGWMQFIPSSWKAYGVDANRDGKKDPYNPVDAIFAAGRYLKAADYDKSVRKAIFAYNRADWYVDSVLMRARLIAGLPADLVGSISGLTQGHFPVYARARYADDISENEATKRVAKGQNAAMPVEASEARRGIKVFAKAGAPVIAVQDGEIVNVGESERLGRFVQLRDVHGNTYTYGNLKKVQDQVPVPKERTQSREAIAEELKLPERDAEPTKPASAGKQRARSAKAPRAAAPAKPAAKATDVAEGAKERLFANPAREGALRNGGREQILDSAVEIPGYETFKTYFTEPYGLDREDVVLKRLVPGRKVIAGTILGRIGTTSQTTAPHVLFEIRPAGRGAPRIDPKPILDGWKLLESTAIYRAQGKNPFFGRDARNPSIGQILLMSKAQLQRRVLANPRIEMYSCGRRDVRSGVIDRRVLGTLEFLASSGLKPTVTSLSCGRSSIYTASGNLSAHPSGNAVDIAKINGVPLLGNQGKGSITDIAVRRLLTLQGTMKPAQIITLMDYEGAENTLALADHADHIHVGFRPQYDPDSKRGRQMEAVLKPSQWIKLIDRLSEIDNPTVRTKASKYAINVPPPKRASGAHKGE